MQNLSHRPRLKGVANPVTFAAMAIATPAAILGVPYDASSSFRRGPARAPATIREAVWSPAGNSWTEALIDISDESVLVDGGDIAIDAADPRGSIQAGVERIRATGVRPILLGGDHSITYPIVRGVRLTAGPITIVHVDAHTDLYDEFEGDRFSHA